MPTNPNLKLRLVGQCLRRGGVIAYPTEAVYGLGCDPLNEHAFRRLLLLKRRPDSKGVILIAAEEAQIEPYLGEIAPDIRRRLSSSWPGPVTWVVPAAESVPRWLTGGRDTLAVRVTNHPIAAGICRAFGGAIVSTSANRSGQPPARSALRVRKLFGEQLDAVIGGPTGGLARPTAIFDARSGRCLRPG